ncbi:MAG: peptidoglycan editing factor PgeF [Candidatus Omnitrophica bacterium]|nr:peptidoglycan editing factor PgeF [Candidatus Omnitrophota bacterium]HOX54121.1 peptidoglycan editing factor PgeF [Candidatus Omnitrophota bacterium]
MIKRKGAYFFGKLNRFPIVAAFSDRKLDLSFDANPQNRKKFLNRLGIDYRNLVCVKQPHKSKVVVVTGKHKGKGALGRQNAIAGFDGLITNKRNIPLAVFTADCLSIFLFCPKTKTIGLVHAGWRGTREKIVKKAISIFRQNFNSQPKDIIAAFGPAIRNCCYEVGPEFAKYFKQGLIKRDNGLFLDLIAINKNQLVSAGIERQNIVDSKICTSCQNKNFFSYRKEKNKAGRMMSVSMLK